MTGQSLFSLDLNLCTGCSACSIACRTENDVGSDVDWRQVYTFNAARLPGAAVFHYSLACNHCREPACRDGCPSNAYTKVEPSGAVLLEPDRCIGCRYCSWVCPYDAPQFNPRSGVMEKCHFCHHRSSEGGDPACVTACPVGALGFVPRGEPGPLDHPGLPELGLGPGLVLTPKRAAAAPPEMTAQVPALPLPARAAGEGGLRSEWPLLVFTYVSACLVAWFAAAGAGGVPFHAPAFLATGAAAMAISALHLGRPDRAWRAVLNFRRSWVSREIVFFSAFFVFAAAVAWREGPALDPDWPVTALGFAALFSMDSVYRIPNRFSAAFPHSAMATLSAVLLIGLLLQEVWLWAPAATVKLVLYVARVARGSTAPSFVVVLRVLTGFVWPPAVWLASSEAGPGWLVTGPLIGEALDRAQFYAELRFPSPVRQIDLDLSRFLARVAS